jgi:hypothetical protein
LVLLELPDATIGKIPSRRWTGRGKRLRLQTNRQADFEAEAQTAATAAAALTATAGDLIELGLGQFDGLKNDVFHFTTPFGGCE